MAEQQGYQGAKFLCGGAGAVGEAFQRGKRDPLAKRVLRTGQGGLGQDYAIAGIGLKEAPAFIALLQGDQITAEGGIGPALCFVMLSTVPSRGGAMSALLPIVLTSGMAGKWGAKPPNSP